jgi:two-component system nitrogen regulation sensor histidine kinase GlnL
VGFWACCYLLWQLSEDAKNAIFWSKALMLGAIFISPTFLHFSVTFINEYKKYSRLILTCYVVSIIFSFLNFTPLLVKEVVPQLFFPYWPIAGVMYAPFLIGFFGILVYVHILTYEAYKKASGLKRNQIKYVFLGTAIGFLGGSTNYPLWYKIPIPPLGNIFVSVYVFLLAYTIVRYRLMDIKIVITSAGIFICVYTLVLGIPFSLAVIGKQWLIDIWGINWFWAPIVTLLILSIIGPYIYLYFQSKATLKIFENEKKIQDLIGRVSFEMTTIKQINKLLMLVINVIRKTLNVDQVDVYLRENKDYLLKASNSEGRQVAPIAQDNHLIKELSNDNNILLYEEYALNATNGHREILKTLDSLSARVIVPFVLQNNLLGFLVLSEREKNETYNEHILKALRVMGNQIALAIENCQFLAAEKEMLKKEGARARRESLDMLVSTMAHEIDNPITSVIGHADIIREYIENNKDKIPADVYAEIVKSADYVMKDAARVSKIIKVVEDYSKGGDGQLKELSIYDVLDPFHTLLMLVKEKIRGVQYTEEVDSNLPPFMAEAILIEEILLNFSENAFHAVKDNAGPKHVTLRIFSKENSLIRIEMRDNGYGIPENILKQLFEVPTTTKGSSEGTGIGLYRIRQICRVLKAKYGAESKGSGEGALFFVEIPFLKKGS